MKKFSEEEHKHLEKHVIMENHERGDFIGKIVKIIDDKNIFNLTGKEILKKLLRAYKEHIYDIETGSKYYAKQYLKTIFPIDYFEFNTLSFEIYMEKFAEELEKEEAGSSKGLIYGTFDKDVALENLRKSAKEKGFDLGV